MLVEKKDYKDILKKRSIAPFPVGKVLKTNFRYSKDFQEVTIRWGETGTLIFFMSKTCEKCDFSILESYSKLFHFKTYIFVEANEEFVENLKNQFPKYNIYKSNFAVLFKELNIEVVPLVYALNKVGQLVAAGGFGSYEGLVRRIVPLVEVFGTGRVVDGSTN
ncbi:hypothetical protein [Paenibacillus sp. 2003]|uniref:hypothetical protein n=1 Tax=Paenibacillus TaxID=44249 RepID=UPI002864B79B|nr:hypothetical protein [Paenibacillus sp. 2003]MDR6715728.1 hypothetical protein [Paenibacillus sp. 2003]